MPHYNYPQVTDLSNLLAGAQLTVPAGFDLAGNLADAISEWEERTGWDPYLAQNDGTGSGNTPPNGIATSRTFDPPGPQSARSGRVGFRGGRHLELEAGLLSLTSLTFTGTTFTLGQDFWLRPNNAAAQGLPYTEIDFLSPVFGVPQSIVIVAVWGRCLQLPDRAWKAILNKAGANCLPDLNVGITGGLSQVETPLVRVTFQGRGGKSPLMDVADGWNAKFDAAVEDAVRVFI